MKPKIRAGMVLFLLCIFVATVYQKQSVIDALSIRGQDAMADYEKKQREEAVPEEGEGLIHEDGSHYRVSDIRVNNVSDPVGIDAQGIFFSWKLLGDLPESRLELEADSPHDSSNELKQIAYQIYVWDEEGSVVWDSGVVTSDRTVQIAYEGQSLCDLTSYTYQIISYDCMDGCAVSRIGHFDTAYLTGEVFDCAKLISMQGEENVYGDGQPVFYKAFLTENKTIQKAYYFGSALGVYDAYLNGARIGNDELKPGWTDYRDALLYNMYDVTKLLTGGQENYLAAMLGTGWWCGRNAFGTYDFHQPALIGQLVIFYEDGSRQTIGTDESWQYYKDTQIQFADYFNGETVDFSKPDARMIASSYMNGLSGKEIVPSYDFNGTYRSFYGYQYQNREDLTQSMQSGYVYGEIQKDGTTYGHVMIEESFETDSETGEMPPITLEKGKTLIVDLGQNIAGVPKLTFLSEASQNEITVTFAEMLNDSGMEEKGNDGPKGSLYRKNYRSAATTVTIFPKAGEKTTYASSFFFTGFRYLAITAKEDLTLYEMTGLCLSNASPETGAFASDNEKLNRLYQNVKWSQRNNYSLIATDCPQRDERLGWTGDLRAFCQTSLYNQDLYSFYAKWTDDLLDAQDSAGAFPDTIPATIHTGSGNGGWAEAGIMVPFALYQKYADKELLGKAYPAMKRYMDYLATITNYEDNRVGPGNVYGDWLSKEETDSDFLSVLWYVQDSRYMQKVADVLGEKEDRRAYKALFETLKAYALKNYLGREEQIRSCSQTELCFLIQNELLEEEQRKVAEEALTQSVEKNDYLLMTGFAGTPILLDTLTQIGRSDLAYQVLLAEGNPSWLYSVNQGATTIWERYDSYTLEDGFADFAMNSFDHFNEGSVAQWMYEAMLGIRVDMSEEIPVTIRPYLPDEKHAIKTCQGSYQSILGEISVKWELSDEENVKIEVKIPCNTSAKIILPVEGFEERLVTGGSYVCEGKILRKK